MKSYAILLAVALAAFAIVYPSEASQATNIPLIGLLRPNRADDAEAQRLIAAFRQGLRELGYVEGRNIVLDIRWAEGKRERLAELAAELVRLKVDIIVSAGPTAIRAAKQATGTIPIIMTLAADPVRDGFVASLAHPGGNITGLSTMSDELAGKRLELLKEAVPRAKRMAILWNPANSSQALNFKEVEATAAAFKLMLRSLPVKSPDDFNNAFAVAAKGRTEALFVSGDALLNSHRSRIVELVVKGRLPAMYSDRDYMSDGGLMYYGADNADSYRRAATYVDKILKGARPRTSPWSGR
jgi:putative ABC transport system substrate-binding protein